VPVLRRHNQVEGLRKPVGNRNNRVSIGNRESAPWHEVVLQIDQNQRGIGQIAITKMEQYCRDTLKGGRLWLDVYEDNAKGKHIYEKLDYQQFKMEMYNDRKLLYYQKDL
jgi:GNAT superfamily N-acetyltransferase